MFFKTKHNKQTDDISRLKYVIARNDLEGVQPALSVIYSYIQSVFPETFLCEASGFIDFQRKTDTNLTIFTITINSDKLSLSYNNPGLLNPSNNQEAADEEILNVIKEIIMKLNFYLIFDFNEEHESISWKHEVYKTY